MRPQQLSHIALLLCRIDDINFQFIMLTIENTVGPGEGQLPEGSLG